MRVTKAWKKKCNSMIKRMMKDGWSETSNGDYLVYTKGDAIFSVKCEVLF